MFVAGSLATTKRDKIRVAQLRLTIFSQQIPAKVPLQHQGLSSFKPSKGIDEMQSCEEVARGFFVACRNTSIELDAIEKTLDATALSIECEVAGSLSYSVL
jgi:hypothetical protein